MSIGMVVIKYILVAIVLLIALGLLGGCGLLFIVHGWTGMPRKKARKKFTEYLARELGNDIRVLAFHRFYNTGNMNPNMFSIELQDVNREKVHFAVYWDAKKEQLDRPMYGEERNTLKSKYLFALERYQAYEAIRMEIVPLADNITWSMQYVTLHFTTPLTLEMMKSISAQFAASISKYPVLSFYTYHLHFNSNGDTNWLRTEIYKEGDDFPFKVVHYGFDTKSRQFNQLSKQLMETRDRYNNLRGTELYSENPVILVNQEDCMDLYVTYIFQEQAAAGKVQLKDFVGVLAIHFDMNKSEILSEKYIQGHRWKYLPDLYKDLQEQIGSKYQ